MSVSLVVVFVLTNILLDLAPGSAVGRIVAEGMGRGVLRSQGLILGIVLADLVWCFFAFSALFMTMMLVPPLLYGAKWAGLACLVWLLGRSLRHAIVGRGVIPVEPHRGSGFRQAVVEGFSLQMTHPTVMIFFFALLSVFAGSRAGWTLRMVDFGLFAVILEWPVFSLYAFLASEAARAAARPGLKTLSESISALLLIAVTGMVAVPSSRDR